MYVFIGFYEFLKQIIIMKKLKAILIIFTFLFHLISCNSGAQKNKLDADSLKLESVDSSNLESSVLLIDTLFVSDELLKKDFPFIDSLTKKETFRDSVLIYCNNLFKKTFTNQAEIEAILNYRNSLLPLINNLAFSIDQSIIDDEKRWTVFHEELIKFGFLPYYAEGMLSGVAISPILDKEITEFCTPEFQLKMKFKNAEATSFGGEYPYLELSENIQMVLLGEEIAKKFPETDTYKEIEEAYRYALITLTDVHALTRNGEKEEYLLHDISRDFWPNATDISFMETFVKQHSASKFASVIKRILATISEVEVSEDSEEGDVYLVVVESFDSDQEASDKVFEYLNKSIDVPHSISSKKGKIEKFHTVYRFYSDKQKADKALAKIKLRFKKARIIHIDFNWNEI